MHRKTCSANLGASRKKANKTLHLKNKKLFLLKKWNTEGKMISVRKMRSKRKRIKSSIRLLNTRERKTRKTTKKIHKVWHQAPRSHWTPCLFTSQWKNSTSLLRTMRRNNFLVTTFTNTCSARLSSMRSKVPNTKTEDLNKKCSFWRAVSLA